MSEQVIGKWLKVCERFSGTKTRRWDVVNRTQDATLGHIAWSGSWRQYVFAPEPDCIHSAGCLRDIAEFLHLQTRLQLDAAKKGATP